MSYHEGSNWQAKREDEKKPLYDNRPVYKRMDKTFNERIEIKKLGLYEIFWHSGGSSFASVGQLHDGSLWFAPCNWTSENSSGIACTKWEFVKKVKLIEF